MDALVHVVSKINNQEHATVTVQIPSSPTVELPPLSIRIGTLLVSLTSNNLSYARGGHFLHWCVVQPTLALAKTVTLVAFSSLVQLCFAPVRAIIIDLGDFSWDTYHVPSTSSAPYNDISTWGIVPACGYAVVLESSTSMPPGTVVWGFWPTSTVPTDLRLKATEVKEHWIEISGRRQKLMNTYNRYIEQSQPPISLSSPRFAEHELERMAWNALFRGVWEGAYLLSQHVFSPTPQAHPPIHPLGADISWTTADADLSSAILVTLSASSKTARSFAYHLFQRSRLSGPLGLLQVTSSPEPISEAAENLQSSFQTRTIPYSEVPEFLNWIAGLNTSKIIIVDFGARDNALDQLLESMKNHSTLQSFKLVISRRQVPPLSSCPYRKPLLIVTRQVYTDEEQLAMREALIRLGKVQYNTSGVQDRVMESRGAKAYFESVEPLWNQWLHTRQRSMPDMRIVWGKGVSGAGGIEEGWTRLCQGRVAAKEGLVYQM